MLIDKKDKNTTSHHPRNLSFCCLELERLQRSTQPSIYIQTRKQIMNTIFIASLTVASATNMNLGGVPYSISNGAPASKGKKTYSTSFEENAGAPVEHFDVYGEVRTKYSQVYWTRNTPINLPKSLIERFKGKTMAITGYEIDQVIHTGRFNLFLVP